MKLLGPKAATAQDAVRLSDIAPYIGMVGAVTAGTPIVINHGLGTMFIDDVVIWRSYLQSGGLTTTTPGQKIDEPTWRVVDNNNIQLEIDESWAANEFIVAVKPLISINADVTGPPAGTLAAGTTTQTTIPLTLTGGTDAGVGNAGVNWYKAGTKIGTTAGDSFTDTGLTANTSYGPYTAKRFDYMGTEGPASNGVSPTTAANPNPPVFDANSMSALVTGATGTYSDSWSHPAGPAAMAIVAVPVTNNGSGGFVVTGTPTCTVGGTSLTYKGVQLMGNTVAAGWVAVFAGAIPSSGSARTVSVSVADAGQAFAEGYGTCDTYTGVNTIGTLQVAQGISSAAALSVSSATNNLIWCMVANYSSGTWSSLSFTSRRVQATSAPFFSSGDQAGGATVNLAATESSTFHWAVVALEMTHQ
jgi:hypothetical protein